MGSTRMLVASLLMVGAAGALGLQPALAEVDLVKDTDVVVQADRRSAILRRGMIRFAKQYGDKQIVSGERSRAIDEAIATYGTLRLVLWDVIGRCRQPQGGQDQELLARLLGTAAGTVLIENALVAIDHFQGTIYESRANAPVRGLAAKVGTLSSVASADFIKDLGIDVLSDFGNPEYQAEFRQAFEELQAEESRLDALASAGACTEQVTRLKEIVFGTEAGQRYTALEPGELRSARWRATADKGRRVGYEVMNALSRGFGNLLGPIKLGTASIIGAIRTRVKGDMERLLQPGDLLMDKTYFTFTDRTIPGHWTHVALWLGTYEQARGLGLFDPARNRDPVSLANALSVEQRIRDGACVLEALRPGVTVNGLEHFLNLDEVVVLRLKPRLAGTEPGRVDDVRRAIICRGMYHLGQDYDFNFDTATSHTLYCSETAYQAYPPSVSWPLQETAGRWTIPPDCVAAMAGPDERFTLDLVYFVKTRRVGSKIVGHDFIEGGSAEGYATYWKTLLDDGYAVPDPASYEGADSRPAKPELSSWARAVRTFVGK